MANKIHIAAKNTSTFDLKPKGRRPPQRRYLDQIEPDTASLANEEPLATPDQANQTAPSVPPVLGHHFGQMAVWPSGSASVQRQQAIGQARAQSKQAAEESGEGKRLLAHTLQQGKEIEKRIQREPTPQGAWGNDKSLAGGDLYYNTEKEANIRKAELENSGKWEQYAVEKFIKKTKKGSKDYWRVRMRGTRTMVNFLTVLRKVEKAYPDWTKEQMVNSLRRLAGYDTAKFQEMYGTTAAAKIVAVPTSGLEATDVQHLHDMLSHAGSDEKETGIVKDFSGEYLAMGHVMTGISGGLHRHKNVDLGYKFLPAGEKMDNLYATTLTGDLGQSAVEVNEEKQKGYVGTGTEATEAELVGDIDGVIIGEALAAADFKKKWDATKTLSDFIETYYTSNYKERFIKASQFNEAYLIDQTTRFAETYAYRDSKLKGLFAAVGKESKASYEAYKDWLSKKIKKTQALREKRGGGKYTVRNGDSYAKIAKQVYGSETYTKFLQQANAGKTNLHPGDKLSTPETWIPTTLSGTNH